MLRSRAVAQSCCCAVVLLRSRAVPKSRCLKITLFQITLFQNQALQILNPSGCCNAALAGTFKEYVVSPSQ
jgi:hypothetical protein